MTRPSRNVLARLLDEPQLVSAIRSLDTPTFHALVEHVGIADAGELVAMATDEQLLHVLDETLWSQGPGATETFSHHAFVTWLEVLLEAGEGHLVDRVCALPEELVAMGIHRVALVVPSDALGIDLASADWDDAERAEKALDACLYLELDDYTLISRGVEGWDAVVTSLVALDRDHHDLRRRLLERCCAAANEVIEDHGGLLEVLTSEEVLEADALADREARRSKQGYVDAASAKAFLALAARTDPDDASPPARDIVTLQSLRQLEPRRAPARSSQTAGERLHRALADLGVETAAPDLVATTDAFRDAMRALAVEAPLVYAQRMAELVYLANVVLAADADDTGHARTLPQAAERAIACCREGFRLASREHPTATEVLTRWTADQLFRRGYARTRRTTPS